MNNARVFGDLYFKGKVKKQLNRLAGSKEKEGMEASVVSR